MIKARKSCHLGDGLFLLLIFTCYWNDSVAASQIRSGISTGLGFDRHLALTVEGRETIRAVVDAGRLSDLRWPNFEDYRDELRKFYKSSRYALTWVSDFKPTKQARLLVEALQSADSKGFHAEDYDGLRWFERLATLTQSNPEIRIESFWNKTGGTLWGITR